MFTRNYRLAGRVIQICSIYEDVHDDCRDYATDAPADFSVTVTQADIDFEYGQERRCAAHEQREPRQASAGYTEACPMLLRQVYRPQNPAQLAKTLRLIDRAAETTALYRLGCNMNPDAAETSYRAMK